MRELKWYEKPLRRGCEGYEFCGVCEICRMVLYNEKAFSRKPLDYPGTEKYYADVMAALRRAAAPKAPRPPRFRKFTGRVSRCPKTALHPQLCYKCGAPQGPGAGVWAAKLRPVVFCFSCFPRDSAGPREKASYGSPGNLIPAAVAQIGSERTEGAC